MPKDKRYKGLIPRIHKRKYEDIGMFFWIEGQRKLVPAATVEQCILQFFDYIQEDGNIESSISLYTKMKHEYYENAKTNK